MGLDVGGFGRWSRLVWGILILASAGSSVVLSAAEAGLALDFYWHAALYFAGIVVVYLVAYRALGERVLARANPWVGTAIFVGPPLFFIIWSDTGVTLMGAAIPGALAFAVGFYVGFSFILQWRIGYGGCEVVSLPIILLRRRYTTYCIPLVALDYVEKKLTEQVRR